MSMNELFGMGGGKPKLITAYTSGTGTYIPTENNARCLVRLQGGGGGGEAFTYAGGGGAFVEFVVRVPIDGLPYVVGAGGSVGVAGGTTSFGKNRATPGGTGAASGGIGGLLGLSYGSVSANAATVSVSNTLTGVSGGGGGQISISSGAHAGFPISRTTSGWSATPATSYAAAANSSGIGGGGDSFYGLGGTIGNSPAIGNYGAGGGVNAAGLGGYIEIWDFGE